MRVLFVFFFVLLFGSLYAQNLTGLWQGIYGESSKDSKNNFQMEIIQTDSSFAASTTYHIYGRDDFGSNRVAQGLKKAKAILSDSSNFSLNKIIILEKEQVLCKLSIKRGYCSFADYDLKWNKKGQQEYLSGTVFIKADFDSNYYSEGKIALKKVSKPMVVKQIAVNKKRKEALPKLTTAPFLLKFEHPVLALQALNVKSNKEIPAVLQTRENEKVKTITTDSKQVELSIYDYGTLDHDVISVYVDKKPVLEKRELTKKPLTVNLELDNNTSFHEVILVAENLGDIPPNTALMKIKAGKKNYEIRIISTEQKNAVINFEYKE